MTQAIEPGAAQPDVFDQALQRLPARDIGRLHSLSDCDNSLVRHNIDRVFPKRSVLTSAELLFAICG